MDIKGGMKSYMMASMSTGVQGAKIVVCFCTEKYQNSKNCQTELKYALTLEIPIIPVICDIGYTGQQFEDVDFDPAKWPCDWLGAVIAGLVYVDFRKDDMSGVKLEEILKQVKYLAELKIFLN